MLAHLPDEDTPKNRMADNLIQRPRQMKTIFWQRITENSFPEVGRFVVLYAPIGAGEPRRIVAGRVEHAGHTTGPDGSYNRNGNGEKEVVITVHANDRSIACIGYEWWAYLTLPTEPSFQRLAID